MPKDFAARGPRRRAPSGKPRRKSPQRSVVFHGPSFSSGAIVGAAIVILAAYAPELLRDRPVETQLDSPPRTADASPKVKFEFPDILRETEVQTDPETYKVPEQKERIYLIQAASFRNKRDADQLRAELLLNDLPAVTSVSDSGWHRVVVGPFPRRVEANRAMTALRERDLSPMWLNTHI
jgi:cell division protein FtsN